MLDPDNRILFGTKKKKTSPTLPFLSSINLLILMMSYFIGWTLQSRKSSHRATLKVGQIMEIL